MINGGYIIQPRLFDKSEAAKMPPVARELWFFLLRNVNYANNGNIKRGQGFFRLSDIQDSLCWYAGYRKMSYSKPQLTKSLRKLREANMVETAKETRGIIITVLNYDIYQDPKNYEGNNEVSTKETRKKHDGFTILEEVLKEVKEVKEVKNIYGEFENVLLTEIEFKKLSEKFNGTCQDKIEALSAYLKSKGKKYRSHYATILTWARREQKEVKNGNANRNSGYVEAGPKDYRS